MKKLLSILFLIVTISAINPQDNVKIPTNYTTIQEGMQRILQAWCIFTNYKLEIMYR